MSRPPRPLPPRALPSRSFFPPPPPRAMPARAASPLVESPEDTSDADATHQLAALDATSLASAPASVEALDQLDLVEDEESEADMIVVEEEPALAADQTGEIAIDDILEVNTLTTERIAPISPSVVGEARGPRSAERAEESFGGVGGRAPDREAPRVQPSSLAPLALDVAPPSARTTLPSLPSWTPPNATSTLQMARAAGIPKLPPRVVVAATSVLGLCLVAGLAGAILGYARPVAVASASSGAPSGHAPRTTVIEPARAIVIDAPATAPGKDPASTDGAPDADGSLEASKAEPATAPAPTAAPAHAAAPARAAAAPARPAGAARAATGVVRVPGSAPGVLVDGAPHKVSGGSVTVACGKHMVKVPGHAARSVVVPCGGAATF